MRRVQPLITAGVEPRTRTPLPFSCDEFARFPVEEAAHQFFPLTLFTFRADPPGAPEISGYLEGETIRRGQTVTLVCSAAGGNPLAELTWFR